MAETMKITLELSMPDNPPLYRELAQFPKGSRRVNRLRTLAHAGLLAQADHQRPPALQAAPAKVATDDSAMQAASLELFGPSV